MSLSDPRSKNHSSSGGDSDWAILEAIENIDNDSGSGRSLTLTKSSSSSSAKSSSSSVSTLKNVKNNNASDSSNVLHNDCENSTTTITARSRKSVQQCQQYQNGSSNAQADKNQNHLSVTEIQISHSESGLRSPGQRTRKTLHLKNLQFRFSLHSITNNKQNLKLNSDWYFFSTNSLTLSLINIVLCYTLSLLSCSVDQTYRDAEFFVSRRSAVLGGRSSINQREISVLDLNRKMLQGQLSSTMSLSISQSDSYTSSKGDSQWHWQSSIRNRGSTPIFRPFKLAVTGVLQCKTHSETGMLFCSHGSGTHLTMENWLQVEEYEDEDEKDEEEIDQQSTITEDSDTDSVTESDTAGTSYDSDPNQQQSDSKSTESQSDADSDQESESQNLQSVTEILKQWDKQDSANTLNHNDFETNLKSLRTLLKQAIREIKQYSDKTAGSASSAQTNSNSENHSASISQLYDSVVDKVTQVFDAHHDTHGKTLTVTSDLSKSIQTVLNLDTLKHLETSINAAVAGSESVDAHASDKLSHVDPDTLSNRLLDLEHDVKIVLEQINQHSSSTIDKISNSQSGSDSVMGNPFNQLSQSIQSFSDSVQHFQLKPHLDAFSNEVQNQFEKVQLDDEQRGKLRVFIDTLKSDASYYTPKNLNELMKMSKRIQSQKHEYRRYKISNRRLQRMPYVGSHSNIWEGMKDKKSSSDSENFNHTSHVLTTNYRSLRKVTAPLFSLHELSSQFKSRALQLRSERYREIQEKRRIKQMLKENEEEKQKEKKIREDAINELSMTLTTTGLAGGGIVGHSSVLSNENELNLKDNLGTSNLNSTQQQSQTSESLLESLDLALSQALPLKQVLVTKVFDPALYIGSQVSPPEGVTILLDAPLPSAQERINLAKERENYPSAIGGKWPDQTSTELGKYERYNANGFILKPQNSNNQQQGQQQTQQQGQNHNGSGQSQKSGNTTSNQQSNLKKPEHSENSQGATTSEQGGQQGNSMTNHDESHKPPPTIFNNINWNFPTVNLPHIQQIPSPSQDTGSTLTKTKFKNLVFSNVGTNNNIRAWISNCRNSDSEAQSDVTVTESQYESPNQNQNTVDLSTDTPLQQSQGTFLGQEQFKQFDQCDFDLFLVHFEENSPIFRDEYEIGEQNVQQCIDQYLPKLSKNLISDSEWQSDSSQPQQQSESSNSESSNSDSKISMKDENGVHFKYYSQDINAQCNTGIQNMKSQQVVKGANNRQFQNRWFKQLNTQQQNHHQIASQGQTQTQQTHNHGRRLEIQLQGQATDQHIQVGPTDYENQPNQNQQQQQQDAAVQNQIQQDASNCKFDRVHGKTLSKLGVEACGAWHLRRSIKGIVIEIDYLGMRSKFQNLRYFAVDESERIRQLAWPNMMDYYHGQEVIQSMTIGSDSVTSDHSTVVSTVSHTNSVPPQLTVFTQNQILQKGTFSFDNYDSIYPIDDDIIITGNAIQRIFQIRNTHHPRIQAVQACRTDGSAAHPFLSCYDFQKNVDRLEHGVVRINQKKQVQNADEIEYIEQRSYKDFFDKEINVVQITNSPQAQAAAQDSDSESDVPKYSAQFKFQLKPHIKDHLLGRYINFIEIGAPCFDGSTLMRYLREDMRDNQVSCGIDGHYMWRIQVIDPLIKTMKQLQQQYQQTKSQTKTKSWQQSKSEYKLLQLESQQSNSLISNSALAALLDSDSLQFTDQNSIQQLLSNENLNLDHLSSSQQKKLVWKFGESLFITPQNGGSAMGMKGGSLTRQLLPQPNQSGRLVSGEGEDDSLDLDSAWQWGVENGKDVSSLEKMYELAVIGKENERLQKLQQQQGAKPSDSQTHTDSTVTVSDNINSNTNVQINPDRKSLVFPSIWNSEDAGFDFRGYSGACAPAGSACADSGKLRKASEYIKLEKEKQYLQQNQYQQKEQLSQSVTGPGSDTSTSVTPVTLQESDSESDEQYWQKCVQLGNDIIGGVDHTGIHLDAYGNQIQQTTIAPKILNGGHTNKNSIANMNKQIKQAAAKLGPHWKEQIHNDNNHNLGVNQHESDHHDPIPLQDHQNTVSDKTANQGTEHQQQKQIQAQAEPEHNYIHQNDQNQMHNNGPVATTDYQQQPQAATEAAANNLNHDSAPVVALQDQNQNQNQNNENVYTTAAATVTADPVTDTVAAAAVVQEQPVQQQGQQTDLVTEPSEVVVSSQPLATIAAQAEVQDQQQAQQVQVQPGNGRRRLSQQQQLQESTQTDSEVQDSNSIFKPLNLDHKGRPIAVSPHDTEIQWHQAEDEKSQNMKKRSNRRKEENDLCDKLTVEYKKNNNNHDQQQQHSQSESDHHTDDHHKKPKTCRVFSCVNEVWTSTVGSVGTISDKQQSKQADPWQDTTGGHPEWFHRFFYENWWKNTVVIDDVGMYNLPRNLKNKQQQLQQKISTSLSQTQSSSSSDPNASFNKSIWRIEDCNASHKAKKDQYTPDVWPRGDYVHDTPIFISEIGVTGISGTGSGTGGGGGGISQTGRSDMVVKNINNNHRNERTKYSNGAPKHFPMKGILNTIQYR